MRNFWIIIIVSIVSIVTNLPDRLQVGSVALYRPQINFNFLNTSFYRDLSIKLGLDLQGGTHLVYEADTSKLQSQDQEAAVESARSNIERRINSLGVSEPVIQTAKVGDKHRLIIELAAINNVNEALAIIGETAQLDFRLTQDATPSAASVFTSTGLTGSDLKKAQVVFGDQGSQGLNTSPSISIEFGPEGAKKFSEITSKNIGRPLAIFLDDQIVTAPSINTTISDGRASITGGFTIDEAKRLAIQLNAGALPVPIKVVEQRNIGATLGQESITKSLVAGLVGLLVTSLYMQLVYGKKGFIATLALLLYVLLSLAIIRFVPVTLTLAGIAGLILSIGMAVDANILIFERIKEEQRWGRPQRAAIELGFQRAWTSIRDSNASTLITSAILFWFGSGSVKGFALTLAIGVGVSLFTAIFVTQNLLRLFFIRQK